MPVNIPETGQKRVVIAGGGFAGLKLATALNGSQYQVVLIDRNNFHQFQPLFYQVATAGLEPSAISFPLRKIFQNSSNILIRITEIESIDQAGKKIITGLGTIGYDYLVLATGANTNFFGLDHIMNNSIPMKSVNEALALRNHILLNFEEALSSDDKTEVDQLLTIVVVGGGPTGVEVSGTLAEMKRYILPKDYPELDFSGMKIYLLEAGAKLLGGMREVSAAKAVRYLEKVGVNVLLNAQVTDYDGKVVSISNGTRINTSTLVWAAGIVGNTIPGIPEELYSHGKRIFVDRFNRMLGSDSIFVLGDLALMKEPGYPLGHPQMAQPAIQQAKRLAGNLLRTVHNKPWIEFHYHNKGAMATIGRNLALVDLPYFSFHGFLAWITWMFIHLMAIVGVKNRLLIFINWFWNYVTYDQSLRLIIRPYRQTMRKGYQK